MANEEQKRAFASYMGVSTPATGTSQGQSQGQPVPQYPGAVAQPAHPYLLNVITYQPARSGVYDSPQLTLLQQFPGFEVPPVAPTPPPAAASSVASFPQSGYHQAGLPAGFGQGAFGQHGLPQRPGPLGHTQTPHDQQSGSAQGYAQASYYNAQLPSLSGFNTGWQQIDQAAEQARRLSGAPQGAMVRNAPHEVMESHLRQTDDYYHYHQRGQSQPSSQQVEEVSVPVMLCHTCSHCGQMRSAGFHRNNPVLPGKPLVPSACRRCQKKIKSEHHDQSTFTRIRSCTADKPCDWPSESVFVDIDEVERRGRRRNRTEVHVTAYSPARPPIAKRTSSQARLGLSVLQQPLREHTYERKVRVSSLSPRRTGRDVEIWPPPDVVRMRASRSEKIVSAPPEPLPNHIPKSIEIWPPPDIVRTHSFRTVERSTSRRRSGRVVELSPSPPPTRIRSTRVVFRSKSGERRERSRSHSPVCARSHAQRASDDAQARLSAHPRPFRAVSLTRQALPRNSDEMSRDYDSMLRSRPDSPSRRTLKPADTERVVDNRRASLHEAQQDINVGMDAHRVHFHTENKNEVSVDRGRTKNTDERVKSRGDVYEHYHDYSRHRVAEQSPPAPPTEDFEKLRVRRHSLSPGREVEEEVRIDGARRISPSPPPCRYFEDVRIRHNAPLPRSQGTNRGPPSPPSPERRPFTEYRHVTRTRHVKRPRSLTPPPRRRLKAETEDVTDSDSAHSGEVTEVRSWRGLDKNGRPATFVEERRQVRMLEQVNERGGEFRPVIDRVAARSWRDV
ncbi:hypothetical protein J1614_002389 [Plenodomus biglobosus]|nr:hypothetical protein J1614_002389 [Plenodomus biglobosus]